MKPTSTDLTKRQLDIVRLIGNGCSNREVSSKLSVSEKTVKNHISRIFFVLRMKNRSEIAVYAWKQGLLSSDCVEDSNGILGNYCQLKCACCETLVAYILPHQCSVEAK